MNKVRRGDSLAWLASHITDIFVAYSVKDTKDTGNFPLCIFSYVMALSRDQLLL